MMTTYWLVGRCRGSQQSVDDELRREAAEVSSNRHWAVMVGLRTQLKIIRTI